MQGFNMGRYVQPDAEGLVGSSGNALHKKRPPGIRGSGEQVVRFEMPFAVWCSHCPKPTLIGQGVRFNAVKTKTGNYYSTPIWEFRIKHVECGGSLTIRTDPQNTTYVVAEGGKKRDTGTDEDSMIGKMGDRPHLRDEERDEARKSAFATLEKTIEDREVLVAATERIDWLEDDRERTWKDPYAANRALRKTFRVGRHAREQEGRDNGDLRDRLGGISEGLVILPETEDDRRRVALVEFGKGKGEEERGGMERPLFETKGTNTSVTGKTSGVKMTKAEAMAKKTREGLAAKVAGSARKAKDPFLIGNSSDAVHKLLVLPGLKRKRKGQDKDTVTDTIIIPPKERKIESKSPGRTKELPDQLTQTTPARAGLVDYGSGSESE